MSKMGGQNLLCVICCSSYKPRRGKNLEEENESIVETVSKFSDEILKAFKKPPPAKTTEKIPESSGDDDIKAKKGGRKKKKKRKVLLEHLVEKLEAGEEEGGSGSVAEKIGVEGRSNIQEILESCQPDNMSICPDCVENMKNVMDARAETIQMEMKVRKLQSLLLKGLRCLQSQMTRFYDEMKKLDQNMSTADISCLMAILNLAGSKKSKLVKTMFGRTPINQYTIRKERVLRLRRQISDASRDLRNYRSEMQQKIFYDSSQQEEVLAANPSSIEEPSASADFSQAPIKKEREGITMKLEVDPWLDVMGDEDAGFGFDCSMDDDDFPGSPAECSESDSEAGSSTENSRRVRSARNNKQKNKETPMSEDDLGSESSESEVDDDDEDFNPVKPAKSSRSFINGYGDRIPLPDLDFLLKDIPEFKRSVIEGVLKRRKSNRHMLNKKPKTERTPFQKHIMHLEYNPDQKAIYLSGVLIHILDKEENPEVENSLECSKCSHKVSAEVEKEKMELAMYDHIISKHFESYQCPICEIKLDTNQEYLTHLKECRKSNRNETCICDICGRTLSCKSSMEQHKYYHMNEEEKAEAVANGFKLKVVNLRKVLEANFACEKCPKKFKFRAELQSHQETHKSRDEREQFICPHCGKNFLKGGYEYHMKYSDCGVALGEAIPRPPVQCLICNAVLKSKTGLRNHMKLQHPKDPSEVFRFVCQQCGKAFKTKFSLKMHDLTHTGLKPFQCGECGQAFSRDNNLKRHEKTCNKSVGGGGSSGGDRKIFNAEGQQRKVENKAAENIGSYPYYQNV